MEMKEVEPNLKDGEDVLESNSKIRLRPLDIANHYIGINIGIGKGNVKQVENIESGKLHIKVCWHDRDT